MLGHSELDMEVLDADMETAKSDDCKRVVSIHKFWVYKAISRSRVNKSSEQNFIKIKDQERDEGNKEWIRIGKNKCIKWDGTHCYTEKFNTAFSLYGVLGITFYFSEEFLKAAVRVSAVAETL